MSGIINKAELANILAEKTGITKKAAAETINLLVGEINAVLVDGGTVRIAGLGTFKVRKRAARAGVNPKTGDKIKIPATMVPSFKYTLSVRNAVKEALSPSKKGRRTRV